MRFKERLIAKLYDFIPSIESRVIDCERCGEKKVHIKIGMCGVAWKQDEVYKCKECGHYYILKEKDK